MIRTVFEDLADGENSGLLGNFFKTLTSGSKAVWLLKVLI